MHRAQPGPNLVPVAKSITSPARASFGAGRFRFLGEPAHAQGSSRPCPKLAQGETIVRLGEARHWPRLEHVSYCK